MPTMKNNNPNMIVRIFAITDCGQLIQTPGTRLQIR